MAANLFRDVLLVSAFFVLITTNDQSASNYFIRDYWALSLGWCQPWSMNFSRSSESSQNLFESVRRMLLSYDV